MILRIPFNFINIGGSRLACGKKLSPDDPYITTVMVINDCVIIIIIIIISISISIIIIIIIIIVGNSRLARGQEPSADDPYITTAIMIIQ